MKIEQALANLIAVAEKGLDQTATDQGLRNCEALAEARPALPREPSEAKGKFVSFEIEREVTECYQGEIVVPDAVIAKGEDAVREYIYNNPTSYLGFKQCGVAPSPWIGGSVEIVG